MKVVLAEEMARIEQLSYKKEGSDVAKTYMENAGKSIAIYSQSLLENLTQNPTPHVLLLCSKGNNSGDAYVCGRYLLEKNIRVTAFRYKPTQAESTLCQINREHFEKTGGRQLSSLRDQNLTSYDLIIDGLLGIGFKGSLEEDLANLIEQINRSQKTVLAIDIPSGIPASTGFDPHKNKTAIKASHTRTLGLPKLGLFLQESPNYTGTITCASFGIKDLYLEQAKSNYFYLSKDLTYPLVPTHKSTQHKYSAGYVTALAGSPGMLGAATLSSKAAFRSGSGIVKLLLDKDTQHKHLTYPELVTKPYQFSNSPQNLIDDLNQGKACYIGPGLGLSDKMIHLVSEVVPKISIPLVLDADGINCFAKKNFKIPKGTILTPHHGEASRLLGEKTPFKVTVDQLKKVQLFSQTTKTYIVLKGSTTFIICPDQKIYVASVGDPGMATAGSGDVLTGVIASFLSQGLPSLSACLLGVWVHGAAGKVAARKLTSYSLMATDIIDSISEILKEITESSR